MTIYRLTFILLLTVISCSSNSQTIKHNFTHNFSIGQSIPLGKYRANKNSNHHLEIARKSDYAQSWTLGENYYFLEKIGIAFKFSTFEHQMKEELFLRIYEANHLSESYLSPYNISTLSVGLSTMIKSKRITLEPQIMYGLGGINIGVQEAYLKNEANEITEIYSYDYIIPEFGSLDGVLNISYNFIEQEHIKVGLNIVTQLSYMKPKINYQLTYSNSQNTEVSDHLYRQNIFLFYFGFGIIARI